MKRKINFKIGDCVKVKSVAKRRTGIDNKVHFYSEILLKDFNAQITGAVIRYEGKIDYSLGDKYSIFEPSDYTPPYLKVEKSIFLWKVRRGLINKEIEVFEEDMELIENFKLPLKYTGEWTEEIKKSMSEDSKSWPRDEKGRWA